MAKKADDMVEFRVVLNGVFLFVDYPPPPAPGGTYAVDETYIEAYLPNMGNEHVYKAGNWLQETTINPGAALTLEGIKPRAAHRCKNTFDPTKNLYLAGKAPAEGISDAPYAVLELPRPDYIHSPENLSYGDGYWLSGSDAPTGASTMSSYQRFVYHVPRCDLLPPEDDQDGNSRIHLRGHHWAPYVDTDPDSDSIPTLFIFCDAERPNLRENHRMHAFNAAVSLLADTHIHANSNPPEETQGGSMSGETMRAGGKPPYQDQIEMLDLITRGKYLAQFGGRSRCNPKVSFSWPTRVEKILKPTCSPTVVAGAG